MLFGVGCFLEKEDEPEQKTAQVLKAFQECFKLYKGDAKWNLEDLDNGGSEAFRQSELKKVQNKEAVL